MYGTQPVKKSLVDFETATSKSLFVRLLKTNISFVV
jgi:hypothetical protein